jgi:putative ABC transport system permease protein
MRLKKIILSFALALENVRTNLFHTVLSVLGIVIGVAALVAILSFIDGMEKYARDQITRTTDLKTVILSTEAYKTVDGVRIRKDTVRALDYQTFTGLRGELGPLSQYNLVYSQPAEVRVDGHAEPLGALLNGLATAHWHDSAVVHGREFTDEAVAAGDSVALVNTLLARQFAGHDDSLGTAVGRMLRVKDR